MSEVNTTELNMMDVHNYYKIMEQNHIMLLFKGSITSELLSSILQITESKLDKIQEEPKVKKKVFNVLVECLQNVYHHIDQMDGKAKNENEDIFSASNSALLMIGKNDNDYFIYTGNHIYRDKVGELRQRLDYLNSLSHEELKSLYQDILANEGFSEKGGAGLGFIDIMRKSGQKLEYGFQDVKDNAKFSFFSLKVKISNSAKK